MLIRCLALLAIIASFGLGKESFKYITYFSYFPVHVPAFSNIVSYAMYKAHFWKLSIDLIFFSDPCDGLMCYQGHYVPTLNYNYSTKVECSIMVIQCMVVERPLFVEGKIIF